LAGAAKPQSLVVIIGAETFRAPKANKIRGFGKYRTADECGRRIRKKPSVMQTTFPMSACSWYVLLMQGTMEPLIAQLQLHLQRAAATPAMVFHCTMASRR
jgi:hypothetical protein